MQKVVFYWIVLGSILFTISHVKAQSFKVQQFSPLANVLKRRENKNR